MKKIVLLLLTIFSCISLLTSCNGEKTVQKGFLEIIIDSQETSKGIEPTPIEVGSYSISVTDSSSAVVFSKTFRAEDGNGSCRLQLPVGSYTVGVSALNKEDKRIGEGSSEVEVVVDRTTRCSVVIHEIQGKGTLGFSFTGVEEDAPVVRIYDASMSQVESLSLVFSDGVFSGNIELDNGFYYLTVSKADGTALKSDSVRVVAGQVVSISVPEPRKRATLTLESFKEYYAKDATASELVGSICYTDTKADITFLSLVDEGVTTDFDSSTVGEKTLRITYKGTVCFAKYNVVEPDDVAINGSFIVGRNTVLSFDEDTTVVKEFWANWSDYLLFDNIPESQELGKFTVGISAAGKTIVKVEGKNYYPDGNGGLRNYPSEEVYFGSDSNYYPNMDYFYVSRSREDKRSADVAKEKYLVIGFNNYGDMFMWFVDDLEESTLNDLVKDNADVVVNGSSFIFDSSGAYLETFTPTGYEVKARNLRLMLNKDGYASAESAFSIVSSSEGEYKGYAYTMKLTNTQTPDLDN